MIDRFFKIVLFLLIPMISANIINAQVVNEKIYSGIYLINDTGKEFFYYDDTTESVKIDTNAVVDFSEFVMVKKEKDKNSNMPTLYIKLNDEGTQKFAVATQNNIGNKMAFIIQNVLLSAPVITSEILNGEILITGVDKDFCNIVLNHFKSSNKQK